MDRKGWIILVLSITCAILLYLQFSVPDIYPADQILAKREAELLLQIKNLEIRINSRDSVNAVLKAENKSLSIQENKIDIIYKKIYEKNNHLPANPLADEFGRVFAENHIN